MAPIIVVNNPYTVVEGEVSDLLDVIFCADDYDDGVKCVISGEYDLNRIGQYHLKIEAQDKSGNEAEKEFTLNVVKKEKKSNSSQVKYTDFKDFYQKYNDSSVEIGLDISKWQGEVDYAKIANEGVSFVMLKVGGQRYSTFGIGFRTLNKVAESFIEEVKRYHYEGILYSSKFWFDFYKLII